MSWKGNSVMDAPAQLVSFRHRVSDNRADPSGVAYEINARVEAQAASFGTPKFADMSSAVGVSGFLVIGPIPPEYCA